MGEPPEWIVTENSLDPLERQMLESSSRIRVLDSPEEATKPPEGYSPRSYPHAVALNDLLKHSDTEFTVILDPDFFLLRPKWDGFLLNLLAEDISMIGAPYHPTRRLKFGLNFPTVTFMCFRTKDLLALDVDFRPNPYPPIESFSYRTRVLRWMHFGTWRDTGWRVCERFTNSGFHAISFDTPLLRPRSQTIARRLVNILLPQRLLELPKRPYLRPDNGLITEAELEGAPGGARYEEFYLRGELMACHLRGASQLRIDFNGEGSFWLRRIANHLGLNYQEFERTLAFTTNTYCRNS